MFKSCSAHHFPGEDRGILGRAAVPWGYAKGVMKLLRLIEHRGCEVGDCGMRRVDRYHRVMKMLGRRDWAW